MKILIACEESQAVCIEMRRLGHEAYSCDIQECSGGHPEWHIQADALELLKMRWDMIIAHPPCTYLSNLGSPNLVKHGVVNEDRMRKAIEAKKFFMKFLDADCPRVAVENPVPSKRHGLPRYDQLIEPYMFGEPWRKKTCLWLKGLPLLYATKLVKPEGCWVRTTSRGKYNDSWVLKGYNDARTRSKTFPGIARAMAEQWAGRCEERTEENA